MTDTLARTATVAATGVDASQLRRNELASFLRNRRERITPEQLGLPSYGRRRTPGLRREEVAAHAGVGVTWYTWLEQGRDINVSEQVLDAIARTLLLDPHERSHLFSLAGSPLTEIGPDCVPVSAEVRLMLDQLQPFPATVTNGRCDLLAYNRSYAGLMGDVDQVPYDQRNTMWLAFTSPTLQAALPDLDGARRRMVGLYRAAMADHMGEAVWKCQVRRLSDASPEFATLWRRHDVIAPENVSKRVRHPELGTLRFNYTNLWLSPRTGVRMQTYTPADPETAELLPRLAELTPRPIELCR